MTKIANSGGFIMKKSKYYNCDSTPSNYKASMNPVCIRGYIKFNLHPLSEMKWCPKHWK